MCLRKLAGQGGESSRRGRECLECFDSQFIHRQYRNPRVVLCLKTVTHPTRLGRLLASDTERDQLSALLRRSPCHFLLKAVRDVKPDYLRHHSPEFSPEICALWAELATNCRMTREQVRSPVLCVKFATAWKDRSRLASKSCSPTYSAFDSGNCDSLQRRL